MVRASHLTILLALAALLSVGFALSVGSVDVTWGEFRQAFIERDGGIGSTVVMELRLPRALCAFAVGGLLVLSGALLQVLLRNPLADPYILSAWILGNAVAGRLLSTLLVFSLSRLEGAWTQTRLLLTGVVVAAGSGALISFVLVISPEGNLHNAVTVNCQLYSTRKR
ncbi:MAG: iron chelate uptake ABC transporter family permease subunit [Acidiferrobacterales bacterium]